MKLLFRNKEGMPRPNNEFEIHLTNARGGKTGVISFGGYRITERQLELLESKYLLAKDPKQISKRLGISPGGVHDLTNDLLKSNDLGGRGSMHRIILAADNHGLLEGPVKELVLLTISQLKSRGEKSRLKPRAR